MTSKLACTGIYAQCQYMVIGNFLLSSSEICMPFGFRFSVFGFESVKLILGFI